MNRREVTQAGVGALAAAAMASASRGTARAASSLPGASGLTDNDLKARVAAPWFQSAKLGIFIHWGLYSVPGWAPATRGSRGQFNQAEVDIRRLPYAEWYWNGLRLDGSETRKYHAQHFGEDFPYYGFQPMFERANAGWRAAEWADLFREAGARYAVLTSKHHEGYRLWPSATPNDRVAGHDPTSKRDLVGDYVTAVRAAGLKAGLYYSGGFDWTFEHRAFDPKSPEMAEAFKKMAADMKAGKPPVVPLLLESPEYADYADRHLLELIDRYKPDILWNDIGYPSQSRIREILAYYAKAVPAGVINDRFSLPFADVKTPEYRVLTDIDAHKWETCRGVGTSFGFNRAEGEAEMLADFELIPSFVDIVSKNGNLLLDVGPCADGSIRANQRSRLMALGAWLKANGAGIYDTVPWKRASDVSAEGLDVRYTQSADAVFAFLLDRRGEDRLTLPAFPLSADGKIVNMATGASPPWRTVAAGLEISLGDDDGRRVPGFRILGAERANRSIPA